MKVGIISEYSKNTLNFGNILQTYALNYFIRSAKPSVDVETLCLVHSRNTTLRTKKCHWE